MAGEHNHYKVSVKTAKRITQQILYKAAPALFLIIVALSIIFLVQPATALTASGNNATLDSDPLVFTGNHRLPPMNYLENDQIKGLTVEIVKAMAKRMEQPINIELMDWAEAQQLVLDGEADALIQINKTEERELLYDFSDTLLESEFAIFIPVDKPGITNILDLRGLTVATEAKGFSILVLERYPLINIKPTPDILSGFNLLLEGLVDAVVADRWVGTYILAENNIKGVAIANHPIDINYSSIAVKKGNTALLAEINRALGEIKQDGTYKRIIDKWQRKEVVYKTVDQVERERLIITGSLAALFITVAFVLVLLYTVKKRNQAEQKLADYTLKLEAARDIALAASRAKSDFLSMMSHEIRTPMNCIMGMADLLAETPLSAEQAEYVRVFRGAGETLLGLINDILDLSKIEAGRLELEENDFDLSKLLLRTTRLFSMKAQEKGLKLIYAINPDTPLVLRGDGGRLRQILLNLLGNAIKFTNKGEIRLTVEKYSDPGGVAEGDPAEGEIKLLFAITDTGIGIPKDRLKTIFEEFTQVDSYVTRQFGGTGLGLTISRRLAERMGGTIWVESLLGLGSTFYFTVVFKTAAVEEVEIETASAASDMSTITDTVRVIKPGPADPDLTVTLQAETKQLHILLVEDNADNRLLIQAFLKKTTYRLSIAENGAEAVEKVKQTDYDLVLMDLQMPVMDGYAATKEIRNWEQQEEKTPLPIIALTAYALKEEVQKALDAGCDLHLAKPVKKNVLLETISQYTSNRHGDRDLS